MNDNWKKLVLDRSTGRHSKDLSLTVEPLFSQLLNEGPRSIDLKDLPVDQVNGMHLAVVLRATSRWKDTVPGWHEALKVAAQALERDGINPQDALYGMLTE